MSQYLGAKLHFATSYHPEAQGIMERFNRTWKTRSTCYGSPDDLYDHLSWVLLALRNTPKQDLSHYSPIELLFGDSVCFAGEFLKSGTPIFVLNQSQVFLQIFPGFTTSLPYF